MNKSDLIAAIAAKTGSTKKDAEATLNAFVDVVTEALKKGVPKGEYGGGTVLLWDKGYWTETEDFARG